MKWFWVKILIMNHARVHKVCLRYLITDKIKLFANLRPQLFQEANGLSTWLELKTHAERLLELNCGYPNTNLSVRNSVKVVYRNYLK